MAFGPVNGLELTLDDMNDAIDTLKTELMSGELSVPLLTAGGEAISTAGGVDILAVKKMTGLSEGDVSAAVSKAVAGLSAQVNSAEKRAREYADSAAAEVQANVEANHAEFEAAVENVIEAV